MKDFRRLFATVVLDRTKTDSNGCWIWQRGKDSFGYGLFGCVAYTGNRNPIRAHAMSWIAFRGPIQEGMCVLHACDVPSCCNPNHLWLGTQTENMRDCSRKGRCLKFWPEQKRKLTPETVREIKRLRAEGFSWDRLAAMFSYDNSAIRRMVKGEIYRDVN